MRGSGWIVYGATTKRVIARSAEDAWSALLCPMDVNVNESYANFPWKFRRAS